MNNFRFKVSVVAALALIATVGSAPQTGPGQGQPIDVYDGFESPVLSTIWDISRFAPGAVTIQSDIVRAGHGAAKIVVHSRDVYEVGANGSRPTERDELMEARPLVSRESRNYEYSFSLLLPADFPIVATRLVVAQWKQYCPTGDCGGDRPVIAVRYVSGVLRITLQTGAEAVTLYRTKDEMRNRWLDFKFQVRFSTHPDGRLLAWLDGKPVVDYSGPTGYAETAGSGLTSPGWFYFKMGLYRDLMAEPMTIYIDEYRKRELPAGSF